MHGTLRQTEVGFLGRLPEGGMPNGFPSRIGDDVAGRGGQLAQESGRSAVLVGKSVTPKEPGEHRDLVAPRHKVRSKIDNIEVGVRAIGSALEPPFPHDKGAVHPNPILRVRGDPGRGGGRFLGEVEGFPISRPEVAGGTGFLMQVSPGCRADGSDHAGRSPERFPRVVRGDFHRRGAIRLDPNLAKEASGIDRSRGGIVDRLDCHDIRPRTQGLGDVDEHRFFPGGTRANRLAVDEEFELIVRGKEGGALHETATSRDNDLPGEFTGPYRRVLDGIDSRFVGPDPVGPLEP